MSEPYLGEVRMFAGNFPPRGWVFCDGQILPINTDTSALFMLLGTTYGGNGSTTFALPDLRGRAPLGAGDGAGLSSCPLGQQVGSVAVTLNAANVPPHTHAVLGQNGSGATKSPAGKLLARASPSGGQFRPSGTNIALADGSVGPLGSGGGQAHENRQPYLPINFIIALEGVYPAQP
jgi:microcystin-dependent protein